MKITLFLFFTLFHAALFSQQKPTPEAKALAAIDLIESGSYNLTLPTSLACLTRIFPQQVDLNYFGVCYKPTKEELHLWRKWIKENKGNLQFVTEENEGNFDFMFGDFNIVFKDKQGVIRDDSHCK